MEDDGEDQAAAPTGHYIDVPDLEHLPGPHHYNQQSEEDAQEEDQQQQVQQPRKRRRLLPLCVDIEADVDRMFECDSDDDLD